MRVTFNSSFTQGSDDIRAAAERMSAAQRQVSSGKRLNAVSDDPRAAMTAISEHASLSGLDAYTRTADAASSRLAIADSVLSDIIDKISAARTVVIGAQGSSPTPSQRVAASNELQALRDAVLGDLNTSFSGTYVFAGSGTTAPYVIASGTVGSYQGDSTPAQVDVEAGRTVSISMDGEAIAKGADAQDLFTVLSDLMTAAQTGDAAVLATGLTALGRAFDRAVLAQTQVGTNLRVVDDQQVRNDEARRATGTRLAKIENVDMADAISRMSQAETSYRAALGAFATIGRVSLMDYLS